LANNPKSTSFIVIKINKYASYSGVGCHWGDSGTEIEEGKVSIPSLPNLFQKQTSKQWK